ncbi:17058_t:CDS:2 [Funneliformis geosporum]|nr:17058_t:CDS:2 [Funneliformis geosporum]
MHSGNMLFVEANERTYQWQIGDFGLSHPANNTSINNEIYGVIPYIAPEIFNGASFSKESDIYSIGMVMWEFTTGCKPFSEFEHDIHLIINIINGKRPEITQDTPEIYANLMKKCWDPDPFKRPPIKEIRRTIGSWFYRKNKDSMIDKAEVQRLELIKLKKLGPEFTEKHPKSIYISRTFSRSSMKSLMNSLNMKQGYISKEHEYDINTQSSSLANKNSNIQYQDAGYANFSLNEYTSKELEFDISRQPAIDVKSTTQNASNTLHQSGTYNIPLNSSISSEISSRKRDIEESEINSQVKGKRVKTGDSLISEYLNIDFTE